MKKILIFTDLDGTLLDHDSYSIRSSKKALQLLHLQNIPVIFCSSKTYEEQLFIQQKLGIDFPFIIENGSAIIIPSNYFAKPPTTSAPISPKHHIITLAKHDAKEIASVLQVLNESNDTRIYGYAGASVSEVAAATGLKGKAIHRAKNRWFTETLLSAPPNHAALQALEKAGFSVSQGGRFLTIQDKEIDKGKAVAYMAQLYEAHWKGKPLTIAIGDSPNDAAMLKAVDKPYLVQKTNGTWSAMDMDGLNKINEIGPKGFRKMATDLLASLSPSAT